MSKPQQAKMDYTDETLGHLLSSNNEIIRRNATSILKQLQKKSAAPKKCEMTGCQNQQHEHYAKCLEHIKQFQEIEGTN